MNKIVVMAPMVNMWAELLYLSDSVAVATATSQLQARAEPLKPKAATHDS
jgi:hypothetical protein